MKKIVVTVFVLLLFTLSGNTQQKKIVIAAQEWAPYIGKDLKNNGIMAQIARAALEEEGYTVEFVFYPQKRALDMLKKGTVDACFPIYYSSDYTDFSIFSGPVDSAPVGLFVKSDVQINYNDLEDLKGMKIGTLRGNPVDEQFDKADFLKKEPVSTDISNIKKLIAGRIDTFVGNKYTIRYLLNNKLPEFKNSIKFIEPPISDSNLHFCVSKNVENPNDILAAFSLGLAKLKMFGDYDKILKEFAITN